MSNTKKPVKDPNPTATGQDPTATATDKVVKTIKVSEIPQFLKQQEEQDFINRQKELDQFSEISDNVFNELVKENGAFFSMRALNRQITDKVLIALIEELIMLRDESNPIDCIRDNPLKIVWQSFFDSYDGTTSKTLTNQANPSQSYRNMLATFPSKIKSIMKELVNQGLVTQWQVTSTKKSSLEEWQVAQLDAFLQEKGVLNPSMEISMRYKVFKSLKGKFIEPEIEAKETEKETEQ